MPATARPKEPPIETLPLEEQIRRPAHELYVQRGNQSGSEFDDGSKPKRRSAKSKRPRR